jgi:hypothetical protein
VNSRTPEQVAGEIEMLRNSAVLQGAIASLREEAIAGFLRAEGPNADMTRRDAQFFINALDGVLNAIEIKAAEMKHQMRSKGGVA